MDITEAGASQRGIGRAGEKADWAKLSTGPVDGRGVGRDDRLRRHARSGVRRRREARWSKDGDMTREVAVREVRARVSSSMTPRERFSRLDFCPDDELAMSEERRHRRRLPCGEGQA